jgi:polysaccharide biosynthesis transport protein
MADYRPDGAGFHPPISDDERDRTSMNSLEDNRPLIDLYRGWQTIQKYAYLIVTITCVTLILGLVHVVSETPTYTAETTILIEPNTQQNASELAKLVTIDDASGSSSQYYKTQCEILRSRSLAAGVIRALGLEREPALTAEESDLASASLLWNALKTVVEAIPQSGNPAPTHRMSNVAEIPLISSTPVEKYLDMLTVAPVADTNLVTISFTTPDPQLSAKLANEHVATYEQTQLQMNDRQNEEARRFLESKLVEIKEQLEMSEAALNDYRRRKGIIPGLISLDGKETVVLDRLRDLSKDMTAAQVVRIGLEPQIELIRKHQYASLPALATDVTIQTLNAEINQLYGDTAALSTQFKSSYPPLVRLRARLHDTQFRLNNEIERWAERIEEQYDEALSKENKLQAEMERQRTETLTLNDAAAEYAILQRDVDTNRELYDAVLTRMKDIAFSSGSMSTNVAVINEADVPTTPSSPNKTRETTLALILGLAGGLGIAFLLDTFDSTLRDPNEAESYLSLPSLGTVPEFGKINDRSIYTTIRRSLSDKRDSRGSAGCELVTCHGSYSSVGEAYRNLRTALLLSRLERAPKVVLMTSATSREGKTVTAVNMAAMLAQLGGDTLLIDADLRRSRCHRVLAVDNGPGLTDVLTGSRRLHQVIQKTEVQNLYFLSAGSIAPNPTELLGSAKMVGIVECLKEHCDYIVIDCSPVLPVSDSLLLAKIADGIMMVVDAQSTPRQQVHTACARLAYARGKMLGVVLNRIKDYPPPYHYYQESYLSVTDDYMPEDVWAETRLRLNRH